MKKIILMSAVSSIIFCSAANADLRMVVGGDIDAQVGFRNEGNHYGFDFERIYPYDLESDKRRGHGIVHDTTLEFKIFGHTDMVFPNYGGLGFGSKIVLETETTSSKYHLPYIQVSTNRATVDVDQQQVAVGQDFAGFSFPSASSSRDFAYNENRNAREVMLFFENDLGRLEFGNTYGATKKMQLDAGTVAAGNGGVHGDSGLWIHPFPTFGNFRTPDFYTNRMAFYHLDDLFLPVDGALPFSTELATSGKISYYSPSFNGLQFGVSFIPDTDITGTVANTIVITENASPHGFGFENVFEGGIAYSGEFSGFGFKVSALGQTGNAKSPEGDLFAANRLSPVPDVVNETRFEDLDGYEFGLAFSFMGVEFAGSYGHHDGLLSTLDANKYYTIGAGYEMGPWGFSVNYMDSHQKSGSFINESGDRVYDREAEFKNLVFDIAYTCKGLMPYLSVASYKAVRPAYFTTPEMKNSGTVVLFGTKLSF